MDIKNPKIIDQWNRVAEKLCPPLVITKAKPNKYMYFKSRFQKKKKKKKKKLFSFETFTVKKENNSNNNNKILAKSESLEVTKI